MIEICCLHIQQDDGTRENEANGYYDTQHTRNNTITNSGGRETVVFFPFTDNVCICRWALTVVSSFFLKVPYIKNQTGENHED